MYNALKSILKNILPKKLLFKYERNFRYFFYLFYMGNKHQCTICSKKICKFKTVYSDKLCPSCGSLSRNRRLWNLLTTDFLRPNISILDFSPSRSLFHQLKKGNYDYTASDLSGDFISDVAFDITKINNASESYDIIICYHILEHVIDDEKAISELHRVLKSEGTCIIQTPFKDGEIYEDFSITNEEGRKKHFGQEDHVRLYSANGLKERLEQAGFNVETKSYNENEDNYFGYSSNESILVCKKRKQNG